MEPFLFDSDNFYESFVLIYKNLFRAMQKCIVAMFARLTTPEEKEKPINITLKKKRA